MVQFSGTCSMRQQDCRGCLMREQCPYAYIFETAPPQDTKALSKYESIPRYEGVMDEFLPFLVLGEQVHVGKYAVFSLGKYRIFVS